MNAVMDEGQRIREHIAMETEGSVSPKSERTALIALTQSELFSALDGLRVLQSYRPKCPPWITAGQTSAIRKLTAALSVTK